MAEEAKVAFRLAAKTNSVELGMPDGSLLRLEGDKTYETSDGREIAALEDAHGIVKVTAANTPAARKDDE